jgi:para-nitrobenzyl esterase
MGQSAGAKQIGGLLTMKTAKGLFHKVILQSGSTQAIRDINTARRVADNIIKDFGLTKETAKELLTMSTEKIVEVENKVISGAKTIHIYGPVFDGINFAEDSALDIIATGEATSVPILIGTNKDEAVFFLNSGLKTLSKEVAETFFGENAKAALRAHKYILDNVTTMSEKEDAHISMLSDYIYRIAGIQMTRQYLVRNPDLSIFMYRFDWDKSPLKASHCMELPFVWKAPMGDILNDLYVKKEIVPLAERINAAWAAFIKTGEPQIPELPKWPKFTLENPKVMVLDSDSKIMDLQEPYIEEGFTHQVFKLW